MGEEATDLRSPHLARVPMMVKAQKAPYPIDVLLLGAQAVMLDEVVRAKPSRSLPVVLVRQKVAALRA